MKPPKSDVGDLHAETHDRGRDQEVHRRESAPVLERPSRETDARIDVVAIHRGPVVAWVHWRLPNQYRQSCAAASGGVASSGVGRACRAVNGITPPWVPEQLLALLRSQALRGREGERGATRA